MFKKPFLYPKYLFTVGIRISTKLSFSSKKPHIDNKIEIQISYENNIATIRSNKYLCLLIGFVDIATQSFRTNSIRIRQLQWLNLFL